MNFSNFNELSESRRSVRRFIEKDVPDEIIIKLLKAAQSAPSAGNCQPWHFYVVKDKTIISQIAEKSYNQKWITTAPVVIVVCADIQKTIGRYGERGRHLYCLQDTAAAIQNILLCAKSLGLGTCWCGAFSEPEISETLGLQEDMRPIAVIPVGYHTGESTMPKRRPIEEIATFIYGDDEKKSVKAEEKERRISFESCNMGGAVFDDVNLAGSVFSNVNMNKVKFSDINMSEAQFNGLNLNNSKFGCVDMNNAEFENPALTGSKFKNCDLSNVEIENCKIDGLKIDGTDIAEILKNK